MSTIDKALPNVVENSVTTPSDEEVALAEEKVIESQGGEGRHTRKRRWFSRCKL